MSVRLAVVQYRISHLDRSRNFARIERFIAKAAQKGAQVIIFPEDCITGSIFGDLSKLDINGTTRNAFQLLAKKYRIDVVTGSCMEGTPDGNFNTSYYIDANGEVLGRYRKNHLYQSEHSFLQPGTDVPVFETKHGRAGIVICWDMVYSEIFQRMKDQGVQIVYCPSYWFREVAGTMAKYNTHSEEQRIDALCLARSFETNCALVYCNAAGAQVYKDGSHDTLIGHSQITMPTIGHICRLNHNRESMIVQDIDLNVLEEAKATYRI